MVNLWKYKELQFFTYFVVLSVLIALALFLFKKIDIYKALSVIFGAFYVLFLPGHLATKCLFCAQLDYIEHIGFSVILSFVLVTGITLFTNNILNIPILGLYNFIVVSVLIIVLGMIRIVIHFNKKEKQTQNEN